MIILELYEGLEAGEGVDGLAQRLSPADRRVFAEHGEAARSTCWTRGFVLTVARKVTDYATAGMEERELRAAIEGMLATMEALFSRLPNGMEMNFGDLSLGVYNEACRNLAQLGGGHLLPANIVGQACATLFHRRSE